MKLVIERQNPCLFDFDLVAYTDFQQYRKSAAIPVVLNVEMTMQAHSESRLFAKFECGSLLVAPLLVLDAHPDVYTLLPHFTRPFLVAIIMKVEVVIFSCLFRFLHLFYLVVKFCQEDAMSTANYDCIQEVAPSFSIVLPRLWPTSCTAEYHLQSFPCSQPLFSNESSS